MGRPGRERVLRSMDVDVGVGGLPAASEQVLGYCSL